MPPLAGDGGAQEDGGLIRSDSVLQCHGPPSAPPLVKGAMLAVHLSDWRHLGLPNNLDRLQERDLIRGKLRSREHSRRTEAFARLYEEALLKTNRRPIPGLRDPHSTEYVPEETDLKPCRAMRDRSHQKSVLGPTFGNVEAPPDQGQRCLSDAFG